MLCNFLRLRVVNFHGASLSDDLRECAASRRFALCIVHTMTRARGQSSRTLLDREFPYQVLVQAESVGGDMLDSVVTFHATRGLPTKKRSVRRDDGLWLLYCFAQRAHADAFRHLFGGQVFKR